jgi:RNA polymerase sigma-70 factor (ECF subfamily)
VVGDTDVELLAAWRAGDREAGERLFDRHFASVRRFFSNKVPAAEVEDLMQRTFEACVAHADAFRGEARFVTYLLAIARSQLHRWLRKRDPVRDGLDFGSSSLRDLAVSPSAIVAAQQRQALVLEALRRIPVDLQVLLELYYWEGLSGPEIAAVLDIEHGTVRSRLHRARELLREQLLELERGVSWGDLDELDTQARTIAALLP